MAAATRNQFVAYYTISGIVPRILERHEELPLTFQQRQLLKRCCMVTRFIIEGGVISDALVDSIRDLYLMILIGNSKIFQLLIERLEAIIYYHILVQNPRAIIDNLERSFGVSIFSSDHEAPILSSSSTLTPDKSDMSSKKYYALNPEAEVYVMKNPSFLSESGLNLDKTTTSQPSPQESSSTFENVSDVAFFKEKKENGELLFSDIVKRGCIKKNSPEIPIEEGKVSGLSDEPQVTTVEHNSSMQMQQDVESEASLDSNYPRHNACSKKSSSSADQKNQGQKSQEKCDNDKLENEKNDEENCTEKIEVDEENEVRKGEEIQNSYKKKSMQSEKASIPTDGGFERWQKRNGDFCNNPSSSHLSKSQDSSQDGYSERPRKMEISGPHDASKSGRAGCRPSPQEQYHNWCKVTSRRNYQSKWCQVSEGKQNIPRKNCCGKDSKGSHPQIHASRWENESISRSNHRDNSHQKRDFCTKDRNKTHCHGTNFTYSKEICDECYVKKSKSAKLKIAELLDHKDFAHFPSLIESKKRACHRFKEKGSLDHPECTCQNESQELSMKECQERSSKKFQEALPISQAEETAKACLHQREEDSSRGNSEKKLSLSASDNSIDSYGQPVTSTLTFYSSSNTPCTD